MIFTINHVVVTTIITLIIYNPEKTLQLSVSPLINVQILQINIDISQSVFQTLIFLSSSCLLLKTKKRANNFE